MDYLDQDARKRTNAPPVQVDMMTNPARPSRPRRHLALRFAGALMGVVFFLAACSDEGPVSGPGTMTATLVSPNGAEGAAVISLLGDDIGSVSGVGNTSVHVRSGDSTLRIILIDQAGGNLAFEVAVPDTTQPPAVVIHEVAGTDDELRPSLDGYTLEFSR